MLQHPTNTSVYETCPSNKTALHASKVGHFFAALHFISPYLNGDNAFIFILPLSVQLWCVYAVCLFSAETLSDNQNESQIFGMWTNTDQ